MERLTLEGRQTLGVSRVEHHHRYLCAASISRGTALDLGCGVGYGATILLANPNTERYVGVDIEPVAIKHALTHPPARADFLVASACHLPFGDGMFDTIVSLETLEHLRDPARALEEAQRVLKPDGVMVGSVQTAMFETFCAAQYGPNEFHLHTFSEEQITTLLDRFFRFVQVLVARVSLAAALYDVAGERGPFYREISAAAPSNGSLFGSYLFVASRRPLGDNLAQRFGVLSVGGSELDAT
jgi:ubiquinone/menaquinone biosynthesis C-methylase UbiE